MAYQPINYEQEVLNEINGTPKEYLPTLLQIIRLFRKNMPPQSSSDKPKKSTTRNLLKSGLVGLWKDRTDIKDNIAYARNLREQAQRRDLCSF